MNKYQALQDFFVEASIWNFVINLFICAVLGFILGRIYIKYGNTISNRRSFAGNFLLLTMTTMLIISVVKTSLALSLGLIGALSIVRFRAAIKEPEELTYLFLAIAVGLGLGADQRSIVIIGFIAIVFIIFVRHMFTGDAFPACVYLTIQSDSAMAITVDKINEVLDDHDDLFYRLKRVDRSKDCLEALYLIQCESEMPFQKIEDALRKLDVDVRINLLDTLEGIGA